MKASGPPFVPVLLPFPCPKCGAQVLLRQWDKRFYANCEGATCRFGFDADKRGQATASCPSCAQGRLKTTPKGRICADCERWDNSGETGGRGSRGACPRCGSGRLSLLKGEYGYFMGCSDRVCGLTYTCDASGRPEGGHCKYCKGAVRKTRAGSLICVVCEQWQQPKPVTAAQAGCPQPPAAGCPACRAVLRAVWTRRNRWVYRCEFCRRWLELALGLELAPAGPAEFESHV